ncbi:MAG TPA: hypothetical protein VD886_23320, partial [Herpetosiphonaceae bacterium]|nr:hypothetical protein [Herpetosiphonaceae bacterium]
MRPPHTRPLLPWIYVALTALGIGLILLFALESTPTASVDLSVDRARAGQLAAEFLRSRGDDPDTRWSTTSYGFDRDAQSYLLREAGR